MKCALQSGIPVEALSCYPIVDYPGWDHERPCDTGLWGMCDENGVRSLCEPLARELTRQVAVIQNVQIALNISR